MLFSLLPGLTYRTGLVAADEERALLRELATLDLAPFRFQQWEGKRRTASFGWSYDFTGGGLQPAPPMPGFLLPLRERAAALASVPPASFEHALVIEYAPEAGIGWHRDRPQFGVVCGISLAAPCTLRFRKRAGARFARAALDLEPGSAYVLDGEARRDWEHSIAPMDRLRYSITFRTLAK